MLEVGKFCKNFWVKLGRFILEELVYLMIFISIGIGFVICFAGYKMFKFVLGFVGFVVGASFVGVVGGIFAGEVGLIVGVLIGGIIGAVIAISQYLIGIFLLGFLAGSSIMAMLGIGVTGKLDDPGVGIISLIIGIIGGIVALKIQKLAIVLMTSILGAANIVWGFNTLAKRQPDFILFGSMLIVAFIGFLVQNNGRKTKELKYQKDKS